MKKQESLCPNCKKGYETYLLDNRNPFCPYIGSYKNGKCGWFIPMEKTVHEKN